MHTNRLRLNRTQIRDVFRLLGEVTELGRDPQQWRSHFLSRLCSMIGARVGLIFEYYIAPNDSSAASVVGMVDHGFEPEQREIFYSFMQSRAFKSDPLHGEISRMMQKTFTRRRCDLVDDETWYSSPLVSDIFRQCNVDDTIYCSCRLPYRGWAQSMSLLRNWGERPFGVSDRFIVSLLNRELGRLWSQVDSGSLSTLPPRLRQTLDLIFCGRSEKEMAQTLQVSSHTIHDFCRRLYCHFGVSGRSRLLTNPDCRRLLLRPALTPAYFAHDRRAPSATLHANGSVKISDMPEQAD